MNTPPEPPIPAASTSSVEQRVYRTAPAGFSHRTLTVNSVSNVGRYIILVGVTFFLTPFIVRTLGNNHYGTWIVILSFVGYANILELGIQRALVKLVAEKRSLNDITGLNRLITTAFVFFVIVGSLVATLFAFVLPRAIGNLVAGFETLAIPTSIFPLIGVSAFITFQKYVFSSVLFGWQLYHRLNVIGVASWLLNALLVFLLLQRTQLLGLVWIRVITDAFGYLAILFLCRRTFPEMRFDVKGMTVASFRELFGFSGRIFISSMMNRLATDAQPIIISHGASAAFAAFFAIPRRLVNYQKEIHMSLARGFMPMFSHMNKTDGIPLLRQIYLRYCRYIILVMLPILCAIYLYGSEFMGLWIGHEYASNGRVVLYLLAGAYILAELFQPLLWSLFIGVGQLNVLVKLSVGMSLLSITLSLILVRNLGINGVALAAFVSAILGQIAFTAALCKYLRVRALSLIAEVHLRPLLCAAVLYVAGAGASVLFGRGSYGAILLGIGATFPIYAVAAYLIALKSPEKAWLRQRIRMIALRKSSPLIDDPPS